MFKITQNKTQYIAYKFSTATSLQQFLTIAINLHRIHSVLAYAELMKPFDRIFISSVKRLEPGFPRLLENPDFFCKIPGPGKSWKITLVVEIEV